MTLNSRDTVQKAIRTANQYVPPEYMTFLEMRSTLVRSLFPRSVEDTELVEAFQAAAQIIEDATQGRSEPFYTLDSSKAPSRVLPPAPSLAHSSRPNPTPPRPSPPPATIEEIGAMHVNVLRLVVGEENLPRFDMERFTFPDPLGALGSALNSRGRQAPPAQDCWQSLCTSRVGHENSAGNHIAEFRARRWQLYLSTLRGALYEGAIGGYWDPGGGQPIQRVTNLNFWRDGNLVDGLTDTGNISLVDGVFWPVLFLRAEIEKTFPEHSAGNTGWRNPRLNKRQRVERFLKDRCPTGRPEKFTSDEKWRVWISSKMQEEISGTTFKAALSAFREGE